MRLLIASVAAFAAVAFAAPSFAQEAAAPIPTPAPTAKAKPGTSAYCNTLKTSTSKSSCLKRVHASAKSPSSHKSKTKKVDPTKTDTSAQLTPPPAATPVQAPSTSQTVAIPPLPQKTI
jgi:hypothetical protein